jgi:ABC-type molybdate transport system substrate-binding protein
MKSPMAAKSLVPAMLAALVTIVATAVPAWGWDSCSATTSTSIVSTESPQPLLVAAASSLKAAFTEIDVAFRAGPSSRSTVLCFPKI